MTPPPSRAEILAALQDLQHSLLASRVHQAMISYGRAFEDAMQRRGSLEMIQLPAPTNEIEAVALEFFRDYLRSHPPNVLVKIEGDS